MGGMMKYINSFRETKEIIKFDDSNNIILRCGLRTNGDIHLGNMMPIISGFIVGNLISKLGKNVELIISLVDLEYTDGEKIPFIYQDDKSGCHSNLADHSKEIINKFVSDLSRLYPSVKVSLHTVSDFLKEKPTYNLLMQTIKNQYFHNLVKVLCWRCKSFCKEWSLKDSKIEYCCDECRTHDSLGLSQTHFALDHDLIGTFENFYFSPDIHLIGRDHAIIEGDKPSRLVLRENYLKQLSLEQGGAGLTFLTPLILNEDGSKMSKSENKGIFLASIKKAFGEQYLENLLSFARNLINKGNPEVKLSSLDFIKI